MQDERGDFKRRKIEVVKDIESDEVDTGGDESTCSTEIISREEYWISEEEEEIGLIPLNLTNTGPYDKAIVMDEDEGRSVMGGDILFRPLEFSVNSLQKEENEEEVAIDRIKHSELSVEDLLEKDIKPSIELSVEKVVEEEKLEIEERKEEGVLAPVKESFDSSYYYQYDWLFTSDKNDFISDFLGKVK